MTNNKKNNTNNKNTPQKSKVSFVFPVIVILAYGIIFLLNKNLAYDSLIKTGHILIKIIPLLFLIFAMMVLMNLFVTTNKIKKHFGEQSGIKGWLYAILFGVVLGGPPYVFFPMLKEMKEKGLKNSYLAVFLYNRNVRVMFIPVMAYYFGWWYTIITTVLIIVFSVFSGIIMEKVTGSEKQSP